MATYYWVGGNGTWDGASTANWSASSGGAAGAGPPTIADDVIFDTNSGTGTCTTAVGAIAANATVSSADLALALGANLAISSAFTHSQGSVYLNSYSFGASTYSSSTTSTRLLDYGTGKLVISGAGFPFILGDTTNYDTAGTPVVDMIYAGSIPITLICGALAEAKAVSFSITAGTYDLTIAFGNTIKNLNFTGFSGTLASTNYTVFGSLTFSAGMTVTAGTFTITLGSTSATPRTITSNGVAINQNLIFNGIAGSWILADNLTVATANTLTLGNGTLNANGKAVTVGRFVVNAGIKTLTLGSGLWTVTGASWDANTYADGLTVSASTATISMTSASAKTFAGGGKTWPTLNQGGAGALTIQQSNTFANITNTVQPATITLTSGTTQTVTSFDVSGTAGNLITLNSSSAGSQATLSDSSGANSVSYTSIKDINATGGATWNAFVTSGNVDDGNNTGWDFLVQTGRYMYNVRKAKRILQQGEV